MERDGEKYLCGWGTLCYSIPCQSNGPEGISDTVSGRGRSGVVSIVGVIVSTGSTGALDSIHTSPSRAKTPNNTPNISHCSMLIHGKKTGGVFFSSGFSCSAGTCCMTCTIVLPSSDSIVCSIFSGIAYSISIVTFCSR